MKKRLISLFTCFSMVLLLTCTPSFAVSPANDSISFSVNEYDAIVSKSTGNIGLFTVSPNAESIAIEELLSRKTLSDNELQNYYGYTEQQISIIRTYNGGPLSDNPQLRGIFGTVNGKIDAEDSSSTSLTVSFTWEWEGEPLVMGFDETIGIRWQGTNTAGANMNLKFDEDDSSATVNYYWPDGRFHSTVHPSFENISPYSDTYIRFVTAIESPRAFGRNGEIIVKVDRPDNVTGNIAEGAFLFNYGHGIALFTPGVSFPPLSFSISFDLSKEQMWYGGATLSSSGKLTPYTPSVT